MESGERKIQLTMTVNFISSQDNDDQLLMHSKSDNIRNHNRQQNR